MFLHAQPQVCSALGVDRGDEGRAVIEGYASEGSAVAHGRTPFGKCSELPVDAL